VCFLHIQPASVSVIDMAINPAVSTVPEGDTPRSVDTTPTEKGAHDTFSTEGRQLLDNAGNKVILRGVNKMSVWDNEDPTGEISFAEIRNIGANSVRIVWLHTLNGAPTDTATLDALITNARANHLIPMIELHDATGEWSGLQALVDYWTQPAVLSIIQKHQAYLFLNIGNEVGDDQVDARQFQLGYTSAVQTLRASGVLVPLVVDAASWGQNLEILDATAAALIEADPRKNLLFSVHPYWSKSCGVSAEVIRSRFETSVAFQYPLIVGEFRNTVDSHATIRRLACAAREAKLTTGPSCRFAMSMRSAGMRGNGALETGSTIRYAP
jgi:mannan endo-1,4-beta-mannosidase